MRKNIENELEKENRKKCKEKILKKHEEVFNFYEEINNSIYDIKHNIELSNDDFQGGIILGLFAKAHTTFQSINFLFKNCFCNNSEELCRILFEETVNISYCSKGEKETNRYLSLRRINQLRIINSINEKSNEKYLPRGFKKEFFNKMSYAERKKELMDDIIELCGDGILNDEGKPEEISVIDRIRKTSNKQLMNLYLSFYRIVSTGVHSSPEILNRYIYADKDNLIESFKWGIIAEDCKNAPIFTSIYFMILNMGMISDYFNSPDKKVIERHWEKLQALGKKHNYIFQEL